MPLIFDIDAEDCLALLTGVGSNDVKIPRRLIGKADFPSAPDTALGLPVPFPYGDFSSLQSATAPPEFTYVTAEGGFINEGQVFSGYAPINDLSRSDPCPFYQNGPNEGRGNWPAIMTTVAVDPAGTDKIHVEWTPGATAHDPPTSVVATALPGGAVSADVQTEYGVVAWTDTVGGVPVTRVVIGWYYYGPRWVQMITTTGTSCEFTKSPPWGGGYGQDIRTETITPGAEFVTGGARYEYAVSALCPDGETGLCLFSIWSCGPMMRPAKLRWTAATGATGYRVYKRVMWGQWYMRFDVGDVTDWIDDLTDATGVPLAAPPPPHGLIDAIYVGTRPDKFGAQWSTFLLAGCAIKGVTAAYQNGRRVDTGCWGVTWVAWGMPGYATYFNTPYEDINGHRYTFLYVRGPDGIAGAGGAEGVPAAPITVMLQGIETKGDATGDLIRNIFDQYNHFVRNIVLPPGYTTGDWRTSGPVWSDTPADIEIIDDTSFAACRAIAARRLAGGYTGRFVVGREGTTYAQETVRTWLARLDLSADCRSGFSRKSQFVVRMIDSRQATLAAAPTFSAMDGILKNSFQITDDPTQIENPITVQGALDWALGTWGFEMVFEDLDLQRAQGDEAKPYTLLLTCTSNTAQIADIGARRLARRKYPYRVVRFQSDLRALDVDLGDLIKVSHFAGFGPQGWTEHPCWVLKHGAAVDQLAVTLTALSVLYAFAPILDTSWMSALTAGAPVGQDEDEIEPRDGSPDPEWIGPV